MKKTIRLFTIAVALSLSVPTHLNGSMLSNAQKRMEQVKQKTLQSAEGMKAKIKARVEATAKDTLSKPDKLEEALFFAILDKDEKKVAELLEDPLIAQVLKDKKYTNHLQMAIVLEKIAIVRMLIDKIKTFPDPKSYLDIITDDGSALSLAFDHDQRYTSVIWLLNAGASAIIEGKDPIWLLMKAVYMESHAVPFGFYEAIIAAYKRLPDPKTALNALDKNGYSAYHYALASNRKKLSALLREAGGDELKNPDSMASSFALAIVYKEFGIIDNLLDSRHADAFLKTSFRLEFNNVDLDAAPLARSVVVEVTNGNKAMMMILEKIKTLENPGQYLNAKSPEGLTPLHYAVRYISINAVTELLKAGADRNVVCVVNGDGERKSMTALEYAKLYHSKMDDPGDKRKRVLEEIIAMLEKK